MDYLTPVRVELKSQIATLQSLVNQEIQQKESWIRKTIRNRWLLGVDPDGNKIGVYRSGEYAEFKGGLNSKAGFGQVDLTLTGALGRGIKVKGFNDQIEVFSTDEKFDDIASKYGDYNFNLSEEKKKELFDEVMATILNKVMKETYALL